MSSSRLYVIAFAMILVAGGTLVIPAGTVALLQQSLFLGANACIERFVQPVQAQFMAKQAIGGYLSPLVLRDFSSQTWGLIAVLFFMIVGVSLVDDALMRWNEKLADQVKVSMSLVAHYGGNNYDKGIAEAGSAASMTRPRV